MGGHVSFYLFASIEIIHNKTYVFRICVLDKLLCNSYAHSTQYFNKKLFEIKYEDLWEVSESNEMEVRQSRHNTYG